MLMMVKDFDNVVFVFELLGEEFSDFYFVLVCCEDCFDNEIFNLCVQKLGFVFVGYLLYIKFGCVQIIGESEMVFFVMMDEVSRC